MLHVLHFNEARQAWCGLACRKHCDSTTALVPVQAEDCCKMLQAASVNAGTITEARAAANQAARAAARSDALSAEMNELRALADKRDRADDASAIPLPRCPMGLGPI